jgi:hypothetical protein
LEQVLPGLESRRPLEGPDLIVVLNGKRTAEVQDSMLVERSRFSVSWRRKIPQGAKSAL